MSGILKVRKLPVVVEAVQWHGDNWPEIHSFCGSEALLGKEGQLYIDTLEGPMRRASVGDFIIKGVYGEFYPCKPDIFWATYELVVNLGEEDETRLQSRRQGLAP